MQYFALLLGFLIGSFLNVCIYRIPRNESIIWPSSHCPGCMQRLQVADLFPVLSFIYRRGKCHYCGQSISVQYPIVEVITGVTFFLLVRNYGLSWAALSYLILASIAIIAAFIDLTWQIIPNTLVAFGFGVGLIINIFFRPISFRSSMLGFFIGGAIILAIYLLSRGGLGGGDVKYLAMIGLFVGYPEILLVLFISYVLGALISIVLLVAKIRTLKDPVPFGPFISIGALVTVLWGHQLIFWYLHLYNLA